MGKRCGRGGCGFRLGVGFRVIEVVMTIVVMVVGGCMLRPLMVRMVMVMVLLMVRVRVMIVIVLFVTKIVTEVVKSVCMRMKRMLCTDGDFSSGGVVSIHRRRKLPRIRGRSLIGRIVVMNIALAVRLHSFPFLLFPLCLFLEFLRGLCTW